MRLPYAPSSPPADSPPSVADIYARIAARRRPRPLIPLDLTLLHSPPVANGYHAFVSALRTETIVPAALLELAVCRVAILTTAVYEWNIHAALALKAGLSRDALELARSVPRKCLTAGAITGPGLLEGIGHECTPLSWSPALLSHKLSKQLTEKEAAVLRYTDEATLDVRVQDATFEHLKKAHFNDREILELVTVVAGYNAVSRILVPLDVGENNDKAMKTVQELVAETGTRTLNFEVKK